jgi:hypothetical protein
VCSSDLNEVKKRVRTKHYKDISEFTRDMNLIWENARRYNGEDSLYTNVAMEASIWFNRKMKHFPGTLEEEWLRKMQKVSEALAQAIGNPPVDLVPRKLDDAGGPERQPAEDERFMETGIFEELR